MECDREPSASLGTTIPPISSPLFSPSERVTYATVSRSPPPLARRTSRVTSTSPTPAWLNASVVPFPGHMSVSPTARLPRTSSIAPRMETSTSSASDLLRRPRTVKPKWSVGLLPGNPQRQALLKISLPISECVVIQQSDGSHKIICPVLTTLNPSAVSGFTENLAAERLEQPSTPTPIYILNPVRGGGMGIRTNPSSFSTMSTSLMLNSEGLLNIGQTTQPLSQSEKEAQAVFGPRSSLSQANTALKTYGLTTKLELLSDEGSE